MLNKCMKSTDDAVRDIRSGSTILVSGFGDPGTPFGLLDALCRHSACDLSIVANNGGVGDRGIAALLLTGRVKKLICSYPRTVGSTVIQSLYRAGKIEVEVIPQGTLSERIRAAAAGLGGVLTPTGVGTKVAEGKEIVEVAGKPYLFELPLHADFALIKGKRGDRWGNLTFNCAARNYAPGMAGAARVTVAEVEELVPLGGLDPECIVTPGIFVDRVVVPA